MQEHNPTHRAPGRTGCAIDHHLWKCRGRWFLNYRVPGDVARQRAFIGVCLDTYDLDTARIRRNAFIAHLQSKTAHKLEAAA